MLLALVLCLSLCACGKSEAVAAYENRVAEIGTVTLDSEDAILAAENAYNALTEKEKQSVSETKTILATKRAEYDALVAAQKARVDSVVAQIDAIGTVTVDSEAAITAAEGAYNALSADEKAMVGDAAKKLTDARTAYEAAVAELKAAHAAEASTAIDAIGKVTLDSKEAIAAARALYDALSADEKALVTNYATLETAEADYAAAWEAERQKIIKEYSKKFEIDKDPIEGISWYMHDNMPNYIDVRSYLIPYIGVRGNNVWMCIRYNYTADDWIFWENLTISVDGDKYYKLVGYYNTIRDNDTEVWEYWDECLKYNQAMDSDQIKMLKAIANSNETIVRFQGDNYHYDLYVKEADKKMIRDALALYEAMLG